MKWIYIIVGLLTLLVVVQTTNVLVELIEKENNDGVRVINGGIK